MRASGFCRAGAKYTRQFGDHDASDSLCCSNWDAYLGDQTCLAAVSKAKEVRRFAVGNPRYMDHMIPLSDLEALFSDLRTQAGWNVEGPLLWGYFFTDPDEAKLAQAADKLVAAGYDLVLIAPADDGSTHVLQVERAEKHTPKSLFARNAELERLAESLGLESYDGMDVGPLTDD